MSDIMAMRILELRAISGTPFTSCTPCLRFGDITQCIGADAERFPGAMDLPGAVCRKACALPLVPAVKDRIRREVIPTKQKRCSGVGRGN